jgi:dTDP-4-dehydrorhamnose reductase
MPDRVLIVGGAGQLGTELVREFRTRGYEVAAVDRAQLDVTDAVSVERHVAEIDPAILLNATAYNHVDLAEREPQAAMLVNGVAVRNLALACRQNDVRLVHFSTDYVFDGNAGRPYTEEDRPHPLGAYAVSKLAGELYARAYLDHPLVIRTSGVYGIGALKTPRGNFIELILRLADARQPIRVVENHVASPTYAPLLAARTADLVERREHGLFHIGGGAPISWFDFAELVLRSAGVPKADLRPTDEREYRTAVRRPRYSALANQRIESLGLPRMPPVEDCIAAYLTERTAA